MPSGRRVGQKPYGPVALIADPDDPRHGTSAGYQAHRKAGVPACEPCKQAVRAYTAGWRAQRGPALDRWYSVTRARALEMLGAKHPAEFAALLYHIRQQDPPPKTRSPSVVTDRTRAAGPGDAPVAAPAPAGRCSRDSAAASRRRS